MTREEKIAALEREARINEGAAAEHDRKAYIDAVLGDAEEAARKGTVAAKWRVNASLLRAEAARLKDEPAEATD